jgi:hypothetical protein
MWGALDQLNADAAPVHVAVAPAARTLTDNASEALASRRHDHPSLARSFDVATDEASPEGKRGTPREASPGPQAASPDELAAEVAALDGARNSLADDPDAALAALEAYNSKFKKGGALSQEAEVLRIEAMMRAGEQEKARALASAFLAKHPSSPLAQRVRSLVASGD